MVCCPLQAARLELKPPRFRSSGLDDKRYLDNVYKGFFYEVPQNSDENQFLYYYCSTLQDSKAKVKI